MFVDMLLAVLGSFGALVGTAAITGYYMIKRRRRSQKQLPGAGIEASSATWSTRVLGVSTEEYKVLDLVVFESPEGHEKRLNELLQDGW